ncbi:hypothetical protein ACFRDV_22240 [Streptomyces fagopyri]|uniref:hypothetical protein n=1 Tax=Streptomyces fagopyri TaxID=2662397 RepID=UPI00369F31E8
MPDEPAQYRTIARDLSPDHRIIAVVANTGQPGGKSDEEILDSLQEWSKQNRPLRLVEEEPQTP